MGRLVHDDRTMWPIHRLPVVNTVFGNELITDPLPSKSYRFTSMRFRRIWCGEWGWVVLCCQPTLRIILGFGLSAELSYEYLYHIICTNLLLAKLLLANSVECVHTSDVDEITQSSIAVAATQVTCPGWLYLNTFDRRKKNRNIRSQLGNMLAHDSIIFTNNHANERGKRKKNTHGLNFKAGHASTRAHSVWFCMTYCFQMMMA